MLTRLLFSGQIYTMILFFRSASEIGQFLKRFLGEKDV